MEPFILLLLAAPAVVMIATAFIASGNSIGLRRTDPDGARRGTWVTRLAVVQLALSVIAIAAIATNSIAGSESVPWASGNAWYSVYLDGVSGLMFLMVSFVGWVISRYSIRYLDGDPGQINYFRWIGFTIGAVSLMVLSGNLLMFFAAWLMTSFGLHQLLLHFPDRAPAKRAAWTSFVVSRIGDGALAIALIMIYRECGTLYLPEIFSSIGSSSSEAFDLSLPAALIVIAAAVKSVQFPFHTWLPQTLETPTPVSALMHAGIVNAGGYLIIRTSPVLASTPWVLACLAIVGALTTCFAAFVMLTQSSVKKSLAYSTIAQMGFMMLQCGLGAFTAAMLHLLAHSMYKAHAFLNSGDVLGSIVPESRVNRSTVGTLPKADWRVDLVAAWYSLFCLAGALTLFGINAAEKPGGLILGSVLWLAVTHWITQVASKGYRSLIVRSGVICGGLCVAYAMAYSLVDTMMATSVPVIEMASAQWAVIAAIVLIGFGILLSTERRLVTSTASRHMRAIYVHASNGFYVENAIRRIFGGLASR